MDLSAAFDSIEHTILLSRLELRFGVTGNAFKWVASYLSDRTQTVVANGISSAPAALRQGVPQGSVVGPILFTIYVSPLSDIARQFNVQYNFYADDSQIYVSFDPNADISNSLDNLQNCVQAFRKWMVANFLKMNDEKTTNSVWIKAFLIACSSYTNKCRYHH